MSSNVPAKIGQDSTSWLAAYQEEDHSLDQVRKYRRLSRLRIVQGSTKKAKELVKLFGEGAVITVPGKTKIVDGGEPFKFVPLFMYTEYCKWSDRLDEEADMILGQSFEEDGEIAMRARDKKTRKEPYGSDAQYTARYVEHLVFPGVIYDGDFAGTPVTISFEKGEFGTGSDFCSAVMMRKVDGKTANLWAQVWEFKSGEHTSPEWTWFGFDISTPEEGSFIREEDAATFKAMADELREKYNEKALVVDRTDLEDEYVEEVGADIGSDE